MATTHRRIGLLAASRFWLVATVASITLVLFVGTVPAGATSASSRSGSGETVATGLDNPRGLALLGHRTLAVAEAGHTGNLCFGPGLCMGLSGQVTVLRLDEPGRSEASGRRDWDRTVVASGLPSFSGPFGAFGVGGVTEQRGKLYFVVGLNPQAFEPPLFPAPTAACTGQPDFNACIRIVTSFVAQSGFLDRVNSLHSNAGWQNLASVGRFDFDWAANHKQELSPDNPEWTPGDADPFGLRAGPSGGFYVVDAASNTLDFVSKTGDIQIRTFIPDPTTHQPIFDAAPTCAAVAPNGDVYVATESNSLYRWDGKTPTKVLSGGKIGQAVGCVADRHGNIYVANLASQIRGTFPDFHEQPFDGSIVKVTPQLTTSYVATGLNFPTGLTLGEDGALYVAVNGLCPKDLSLLNSSNSPPGACPEPGKVVRFHLEDDD